MILWWGGRRVDLCAVIVIFSFLLLGCWCCCCTFFNSIHCHRYDNNIRRNEASWERQKRGGKPEGGGQRSPIHFSLVDISHSPPLPHWNEIWKRCGRKRRGRRRSKGWGKDIDNTRREQEIIVVTLSELDNRMMSQSCSWSCCCIERRP